MFHQKRDKNNNLKRNKMKTFYAISNGQQGFSLLAIENDVVIKRMEYVVKEGVNPYEIEAYLESKIYVNEKLSNRYMPTLCEISKEQAAELANYAKQNESKFDISLNRNIIVEERRMFNCTYKAVETLSHYNNLIKKF